MAIRKITFDGSQVSSKDDADFYYHLLDLTAAGVVKGLYNDCTVTAGNNLLTVAKGVVAVYGRLILVESNSQVAIILDSVKYGYLILKVDLATNVITLYAKEGTSTYPTLTQNNLHNTAGIYELPLARYQKTATSLTLDSSFVVPSIKSLGTRLTSLDTALKTYVEQNYGSMLLTPLSAYGATIARYDVSSLNLNKTLFTVRLRNQVSLTFSGRLISSSSLTNISYLYLQTSYYFIVEYSGGEILLYSSTTDYGHQVADVQVWR